jgi:hypothetical protein
LKNGSNVFPRSEAAGATLALRSSLAKFSQGSVAKGGQGVNNFLRGVWQSPPLPNDNRNMAKFSKRVQNLIADFRGLPRDDSSSVLKEELAAGQLFQNILKKYVNKSDVTMGTEIFENWPQIVGDILSILCTPHRITAAGALVIKVQNSVVRQELYCRKEEILQRIRQTCPRSGISEIVFSF